MSNFYLNVSLLFNAGWRSWNAADAAEKTLKAVGVISLTEIRDCISPRPLRSNYAN
jgi:hypothetical protein